MFLRAVAAAFLLSTGCVYAAGTGVESVKFIQYLDEDVALEEVRRGNLDMYYYRISSDRIEDAESREGLKIYESTGGSYSILVNPAEADRLNPFSIREARFALNYLVDRNLVVNELMGGYGVQQISNYGPFDSEYMAILNQLEEFQFEYNPALADRMISDALHGRDASRDGGTWMHDDAPVTLTIFIRSDDPVRKAIGEILASELESLGFAVDRDFGDLNKAFVVVYGSDPAELRWNLYTEGWGGRSAFVRYDSVGLAQMYSPWFSNMPGFNNPSYWNYENPHIDNITQRIYTGNFTSQEQRDDLIRLATVEAVNESVRIFLASKIDQYVVNTGIDGIINDFGAGVPTRFTPINARSDDGSLVIGVKQIYQGAWNPVRGLTDSYSTHIWNPIHDPGLFKHPYTGKTIPIRSQWHVETAGPDGTLKVPPDAVIWNTTTRQWEASTATEATSKVTFDLELGNWHNNMPVDMNDIMYAVYFGLEWGIQTGDDDVTYDIEFTPQASQLVSTLAAVRPTSQTQIEVYVNYWHFDESEIAAWASVGDPAMPWEIFASMEKSVTDGKVSFSRSGASSKSVNWLSLIVPNDAGMIADNLEGFGQAGFVPPGLYDYSDADYLQDRYASSVQWIRDNNHAVISNGPFYLKSYSPESRTITLAAFEDPAYPFAAGHWREFETARLPKITGVDAPVVMSRGDAISIRTDGASHVRYFLSNATGIIMSGILDVPAMHDASAAPGTPALPDTHVMHDTPGDMTVLHADLHPGTYAIKIFATSDQVMRPDFYSGAFIISDQILRPLAEPGGTEQMHDLSYVIILLGVAAVAALTLVLYVRHRQSVLG